MKSLETVAGRAQFRPRWWLSTVRLGAVWLGTVGWLALTTACVDVEQRRQSTLKRADQQLALGDSPRALQILNSFLSYDPRDLEIHARMAEIHLDSGTSATALRILESVPGDVDLDARSTRLLARALVAQGHLRRAIDVVKLLEARGETVDRVLDDLLDALSTRRVPRYADLPDPWVERLVEMQLEKERFAVAVDTLDRLPDGDSRRQLSERLIREAWIDGEVEVLADMPELDQEPESPWKLLVKHRVLIEKKRFDEAAILERRFLEDYPDHTHRYDMLLSSARRELRSGAPGKSLALARSASTLRPSESAPLMEQALALEALGRADEAERTLELLLASWPSHSGAARLLSRLDRRRDGVLGTDGARIRLSIDTEGGS